MASALSCPICTTEQFIEAAYPRPTHPLFAARSIRSCPACHVSRVHPPLNDEDLKTYYATAYSDFISRVDGTRTPETYFANAEALDHGTRSEDLLRLARRHLRRSAERMLDIGSGKGEALFLADRVLGAKIQKFAVEPDDKVQPYLQYLGVETLPGVEALPEQTFDVCIACHVVEHFLADRLHTDLRRIHDSLRPGGVIVVEVPSANLVRHPEELDGNHEPHTLFFSPRGLRRAMQDAGFEIVAVFTAGTPRPHRRVQVLIFRAFRKAAALIGKRLTRWPGGKALRVIARRAA